MYTIERYFIYDILTSMGVFGRGKIILSENNFSILHRLAKQGGENNFQGKIILRHLKEIVFPWKSRKNDFSGLISVA